MGSWSCQCSPLTGGSTDSPTTRCAPVNTPGMCSPSALASEKVRRRRPGSGHTASVCTGYRCREQKERSVLLQPPKAQGGPQNSSSRLSATSLRRERKLRRRARIGTHRRPRARSSALAGHLGPFWRMLVQLSAGGECILLLCWAAQCDAQRSATLDLASPEGREAGDAVHGARLALKGNGAVVLARQVEAERQQRGLLTRRRRRHMVRQRLASGAQHGRAQRPEVVHHQRSAAGRAGAGRQRRWGRNGSRS